MSYALLPLLKNKLQRFNNYFMLLDTFGHQLIFKRYKLENVSKITIQGNNNQQELRTILYLNIDILSLYN